MAAADFSIKAHDTLPTIMATFMVDGVPVDLSGATVRFIMKAVTGGQVKVNSPAVLVDVTNGVVRYDWAPGDTDTPGSYQAEWEVTWPGPKKQTVPTLSYHTINILADLDNA